jgi:hypothetical protein
MPQDTTLHAINEAYEAFLRMTGLRESEVPYNAREINEVIDRYWKDVKRLKDFHGIKYIDSHKIAGYLTYWICKIRPFYVENPGSPEFQGKTKYALFANEIISILLSMGRINAERVKKSKSQVYMPKEIYQPFTYHLRYRRYDADSLTLIYYLIDTVK